MARPAKKTGATLAQGGTVVGATFEETEKTKSSAKTSETVVLAVSLPHGLKFDDVPCSDGGTKTIVFPGLNDALRSKREGILIGRGNAVAFKIDKTDWENILKMHGKEAAFTGVNGGLPCIIPMKDEKEFKSRSDELKEIDHGVNPVDPEKVGVKETNNV
ncbi:hypothetical protein [uncultured Parasutterella sp.]|uniref:hypothetical protein n=1 Tax=uncultured Parasutterella sp. TaxID=1263098 RepID=UPI00272DC4F6|nr:hypothetical protein [uncultured Parasutterella sp.]